MNRRATFASLRWTILRHGPHDDRAFGLVVGLLVAAGILVLTVSAGAGLVHPSWLTAAVSLVGLTWLIGPFLVPGAPPLLEPGWFRTLPGHPARMAREMAASEALSVGTLVTAAVLSSLVVIAAPHGPVAVAGAVLAAVGQLFLLLWLGRTAQALVAALLRSVLGAWVVASQTAVLLALSFAGWVPVMAFVLPGLGEGRTELVAPPVPGALPAPLEAVLLALPTGWGLAAVQALASPASWTAAVLPLAGLVAGGTALRELWIGLMAGALRRPPDRPVSSGSRSTGPPERAGGGGAVRAVTLREIRTWFRDPHRRLGLVHAWATPLLMIPLVAPTDWSWALPFIGVMAAVLGGMAAVNTYALDGTALWQLLTTPGSVRADVRGRQAAWLALFGVPALVLTGLLAQASGSPFAAQAGGMALAATGTACGGAPWLSSLMPAIGPDARERVSTASPTGNAAGGQWTLFTLVATGAALPPIATGLTATAAEWPAALAAGAVLGGAAVLGLQALTVRRLDGTGRALLAAMASRDVTRLRRS
ncbi:MAG TPA: hypothetical protein VIG75_13195 [Citricoccus sp.]